MNYAVFNSDSYVWKTLDVGYVQGMCDLVAPLLVIFDSGKLFDSGICCDKATPLSHHKGPSINVDVCNYFCEV